MKVTAWCIALDRAKAREGLALAAARDGDVRLTFFGPAWKMLRTTLTPAEARQLSRELAAAADQAVATRLAAGELAAAATPAMLPMGRAS